MESVSKIKNFGLKMMVKSGLEKIFLEIPPCGSHFEESHKFSNQNNHLPAWRKIDLLEQKFYRDSNLRVKLMYESVK
jgi:hypothetical protein